MRARYAHRQDVLVAVNLGFFRTGQSVGGRGTRPDGRVPRQMATACPTSCGRSPRCRSPWRCCPTRPGRRTSRSSRGCTGISGRRLYSTEQVRIANSTGASDHCRAEAMPAKYSGSSFSRTTQLPPRRGESCRLHRIRTLRQAARRPRRRIRGCCTSRRMPDMPKAAACAKTADARAKAAENRIAELEEIVRRSQRT